MKCGEQGERTLGIKSQQEIKLARSGSGGGAEPPPPNCRPPHRMRGRGGIASMLILQLEGGRGREVGGGAGKRAVGGSPFSAPGPRKTRLSDFQAGRARRR